MNDNLRRRYEMLLRVQDYSVQYATSFPVGTLGQEYFLELAAIIIEIERLAAAQRANERSAREGTSNRGETRTDLREEMEAISQTARSMAVGMSGLEDKFRMPYASVSDVDLLNTARAFATNALPLKDEFLRHGLPADFLDKLNAAIEAFAQAIDKQQRSKRERASATEGLGDAVERGVNKVRQLDAVVRNRMRDNRVALSEWESASHVERTPASTSTTQAQPNTPPTT